MNEISNWFSSLWQSPPQQSLSLQLESYSYEPITAEIMSNPVSLRCQTQEKKGILSQLYLGLDEGKPCLRVVHDVRGVFEEERFMILHCHAESGRGAGWYVEYQCPNGIVFRFTRSGRIIEVTVKRHGRVLKYYTIDVKREPRYIMFDAGVVKPEMYQELRDVYAFAELFMHAY